MKTVILAVGYGTRLSEETGVRPKPMVEIGGMPILWHIMKIYSSYGYNDFIICLGYKGNLIKDFSADYRLHYSNLTIDLRKNSLKLLNNEVEPWKITLVDTGETTTIGGRLKRVKEYLENETFFMTYGDGVSDVNISKLLEFHKNQGTYATLTTVQPPGRFGILDLERDTKLVTCFYNNTKNETLTHWINGGFFVLEPKVIDYLKDDYTLWGKTLEILSEENQLSAYRHYGFWQNMDTLMDKNILNEIWDKSKAPWKRW